MLPDLDVSTPAVVLKLDPNVMHHGGLGAIRSLGRLGVPVYGVHEDRLAPAAGSRYLQGRWFWRPPAEDPEPLVAGLQVLAERIGRPAVLIPTDDAGAIFLAEHGDPLRSVFRFPAPPPDLPRRVAGKLSLHRLCAEYGISTPPALAPGSLGEARRFADRIGFPVVVKLATPWRPARRATLRSTMLVGTPAELERVYRESGREPGAELMLQEFIPGGAGSDRFFHGYCDARSVCRPAFTGIKDRSYPHHAGLTCLGRSANLPILRRTAVELLARTGYRGIVDLDFRWNARDRTYQLLDFNPRLGAQFRLFRDQAGVDVVIAAYLDLTGRAVPAAAAVTGRRFVVENYDPIAAIGYRRVGELDVRAWLSSVRGAEETAWFARDDLLPFGLMCLRMGQRVLTRPLRCGRWRRAAGGPSYRPGRAARRRPPAQRGVDRDG
ncbi:carboxylate--amine ligase [Pseudonocardia hispaniensis]|uniref:Carboxylate--amine ligase n=1 Tax=Pseudonocardia hispaniensis TaxID=904933 RepID=A0ABW1J3B2_9PSEU